MNIQQYLQIHFPNSPFEPPLFYNIPFGIRFELGVPYRSVDDPKYLHTVLLRSTMLFDEVFNDYEEFFIVVEKFRCVESFEPFNQGIDVFPTFLIDKKLMRDVHCFKTEEIFENDGQLIGVIDYVKLRVLKRDLNYKGILKAIGNQDFLIRPYVKDRVFFIEPRKNIIYHMYDDRGLDVVSDNKEALEPLFTKFNSWILDYDREEIEKTFKK